MEQRFSCLHPNPGWGVLPSQDEEDQQMQGTSDVVGKHCILELYGCHSGKLNDEAFVRTIINIASRNAGANLLNLITHRFEPQGVTGLALLAESHISIHTWPENGYAAVDVFTCGDHTMPERACEILCNELLAKRFSLKSFHREPPEALKNTERKPTLIDSSRC